MSVLEGPFADYLERNRARCNTRFAMLGGRVRPELGYSVIRDIIAPLAEQAPPAKLTDLSHALIDSAFALLRKGLIGPEARSVLINVLWTEGLPKLMSFMIEQPKRVIAALSNAIFRLEQDSEQAARQWLRQLLTHAPYCSDVDTLLKLGQVLAWTNGQSEYRASAIAVWETLPSDLKRATLGTESPQWDNRWLHPNDRRTEGLELSLAGRLGGHIDLGGLFECPPMLTVYNGQVIAFDSARYLTIFADSFGIQSRPFFDEPPLEQPDLPSGIQVLKKGAVCWGDARLELPELAQASSIAFAEDSLMVTVEHSFFVFIFARVAP